MRSRCERRELSRGLTKDEVEMLPYILSGNYPEKTRRTPQHHSLKPIISPQLTAVYKEGINKKAPRALVTLRAAYTV
jgi:hypothetical protein